MLKNTSKSFNFLFLIDFSESSLKALNYLIKFCKKIDGTIELFYVFDTTNLGEESSAISVLKSIETEKVVIKRKLNSAVEMIEAENVPATSAYTYGNLELEIQLKIIDQPQILALSKSNIHLFGSLSFFLINKCNKNILLIADEKEFMSGNSVVIGGNEVTLSSCEKQLPISLASKIEKPIIVLYPDIVKSIDVKNIIGATQNVDVFSKSITHNRTIDGFKEFVNNNKVELLCICRTKSNDSLFKKLFNPHNLITDVITQIDTSLLIMGENKSA